jgi:hypothetical protein
MPAAKTMGSPLARFVWRQVFWRGCDSRWLDGLSARSRGLVEDLHLVLGEQAIGVAYPQVFDDLVELVRACDGDSVGDVVDQHAGLHEEDEVDDRQSVRDADAARVDRLVNMMALAPFRRAAWQGSPVPGNVPG